MSLDGSAARVRCLEGELARFKAAKSKEVGDATSRVAADQLDAHQQNATVLNQGSRDSQAELRRFTKSHTRDREKPLRQSELVVGDHYLELWSSQEGG